MFNLNNVEKVYSGKIGCMCGCLGKYSYNAGAKHEDWQGKENVRSVKIMFNKVMKDPNKIVEGNVVYVEENNRIRAIYFKE